jgi:hypothetical protein
MKDRMILILYLFVGVSIIVGYIIIELCFSKGLL